jgi:hypothetical protein
LGKLEKNGLVDNKFPINLHKNELKTNSEIIQQLSRMLDANLMKIYYENSIKYQLLRRAIDIK